MTDATSDPSAKERPTPTSATATPSATTIATPIAIEIPPPDFAEIIADEVNISRASVAAIIRLLDEGATVPFIARYRKEQTGGAEDVEIQQAMERLQFHREFLDRKNVILGTIADQGKLTAELRARIEAARTRTELEDIYLPYRPKRRTRATMAKEKGLEPLANRIWSREDFSGTPEEFAAAFVDEEKGVLSADAALQGARDILAEKIIETPEFRATIRDLTWRRGLLYSQVVKDKAETKSKFTDYYEFSEPVARIPSHRILAILRGEKEGFLQQKIHPDLDEAKETLLRRVEAAPIVEPDSSSAASAATQSSSSVTTAAAAATPSASAAAPSAAAPSAAATPSAPATPSAAATPSAPSSSSASPSQSPNDPRKASAPPRIPSRASIWRDQIRLAAEDAYERLLMPQIATDVRVDLKLKADDEAIEVFAKNLRDLLMAAPYGGRPVLAIDPGFRTGCKVVVLSETGKLLDHGVVYPTEPKRDIRGTEAALDRWFRTHPEIAAVAIGNGTGGRETFSVVREYLKSRGLDSAAGGKPPVQAVLVNESGASVYSASEVAREELPGQDVTVRGAVSIGRRLQDPLAELVKIDPKSIGVGQYQHDVDQRSLQKKLDDVVVTCVNQVGVDANTASPSLLQYVSGLGPKIAKAMVEHRDSIGAFQSRKDFLRIPGLGKKTFEQAAGFLRLKGANPLDNSSVHPERYDLVEQMAADLGKKVGDLIGDKATLVTLDLNRYVGDTVGLFTLRDILAELEKPGRDPREDFEAIEFREDVNAIEDLKEGMILSGTVTNVTHFGAFVDVGVHQDGLVHVSQIANRFVKDPADELHVGQTVKVKVMEVELERKRIALSIKATET